MLTRISRIKMTSEQMGLVSGNIGVFGLFDNQIKTLLRVNDEEYDFLCDNVSDEDWDLFFKENKTFSDKKVMISILNNSLKKFNGSLNEQV